MQAGRQGKQAACRASQHTPYRGVVAGKGCGCAAGSSTGKWRMRRAGGAVRRQRKVLRNARARGGGRQQVRTAAGYRESTPYTRGQIQPTIFNPTTENETGGVAAGTAPGRRRALQRRAARSACSACARAAVTPINACLQCAACRLFACLPTFLPMAHVRAQCARGTPSPIITPSTRYEASMMNFTMLLK